MTAHLYASEPCWVVDNDPWESPHFRTEAEARKQAERESVEREDGKVRPVIRERYPCWTLTCDVCDYEPGVDDYGHTFHYPGEQPPVEREGWEPGKYLCDEHLPARPWSLP